jgi:hypothetical protein
MAKVKSWYRVIVYIIFIMINVNNLDVNVTSIIVLNNVDIEI